jgi:acyl-coenzyme A synthetase/AMP-(fatty) acid ligase
VIGEEDADGLVKPKAFVVLKPGFKAEDGLFDELKWKYPRWVEIRSELPKTSTGKIQRFKLRER